MAEQRRKYDSTVARIAGNLLSGVMAANDSTWDAVPYEAVEAAVRIARAIVLETQRQEGEATKRDPPDAP